MNKIAAVILCSFVALFCVDLVISDVSHLNPSARQQDVVTDTCLGCICEAISGCNRTTVCQGDVCGLFRLTWAYWADSGKPTIGGEPTSSETAYANCANDPYCAASAVQGYMARFGQDCNNDGTINCYDHAAIHIKGGYGCGGDLPEKYRYTFNECIGQFLGQ